MESLGRYSELLATGRMSRRDFITKLTALGLSATAISTMLPAAGLAAETPKRGGRLRLGWYTHSANDSLDPATVPTSLGYTRIYCVMSTLTRWNRNLEPTPDLAIEWEPSNETKTWTFRLRKGVEFHDGKSLTPQDVIYSLQYHIAPDSKSAIKSWLQDIVSMKADGDDLVRIDLARPNADLPMYLGDVHAAIFPDGWDVKNFDNVVGTGPYKTVSFEPGVNMLSSRYENYYDSNLAFVDEVESYGIGDTAARLNALLSGDVDFIVRIDPKTVDIVKQTEGVAFEPTKSSRHIAFPMMADREPFKNDDLRMAFKYMAERQDMLDKVQLGHGMIGNDVVFSPLDKYYCKELSQREFDPEKAKFYLDKAGYGSGLSIDLHTSEAAGGTTSPELAAHFRESAAKVGVNVNVVKDPADGYWSAVWMQQSFHMADWFARPTADLRLSLTNLSDAAWNEGKWGSPEVDKLILEARGTLDGPKRYELYAEVQKILQDKDGRIIPIFTDFLDARSSRVKGYVPHQFSEAAACRLCEEVWLDG